MMFPTSHGSLFSRGGSFVRKSFLTNNSKQFLHIFKYFKNSKLNLSKKFEINGDKIADHARMQEKLWKTLVPEKYITFNSSSFIVLASLTLALHQYNSHREKSKFSKQDQQSNLSAS
ncbi:uncharacterized protein ELE39_002923 [Cryptosporidium sp. chipmunk genotype I]|uniref:uncharacterized protein n=1 Tax=Cryptosporidium sp. chipmunk genotype I TaxID=1280935 RepID=UPI00351A26A1|nr:hypothetical protein ELE39_002923 [Cryptosporidium sp. chipmunk genotype I]